MKKEIIVLKKEPGKSAELVPIRNTLEALQEAVGGYIETYTLPMRSHAGAVVICNEDGKILDLPYNITILGEHFVGTILIAGVDGEEFDDVPGVVASAWLCCARGTP